MTTTLMRAFLLLALLAGAASCKLGKNAAGWPVAKQPQGAAVTVRTGPASFSAELIEVTADGFVLKNAGGKLLFAPFTIVDNLSATRLGSGYRAGNRMPPSAVARANLVMVSHFPQGMTPEIRQKMLAASGQSEIEVIR